jgi:predicted RNA binding protein YcfA (HicA-like mRNA interferase family)
VIRALKRAGFVVHAGRAIQEPLLRAIVRDAQLTVGEFVEMH